MYIHTYIHTYIHILYLNTIWFKAQSLWGRVEKEIIIRLGLSVSMVDPVIDQTKLTDRNTMTQRKLKRKP